jgi:hypothetical protein
MTQNSTSSEEKAESKTYIRKGFWLSLGAAAGIGLITLSAGLVLLSVLYRREIMDYTIHSWEKLWYSQEQKDFVKCYTEEFSKYMSISPTSITPLPKTPTQICKERGHKPFPPFKD